MDTISQIQVNDIVYEICDTEARNSISQINNTLSNGIIAATYTGSSSTANDTSSGWKLTWFNVLLASNGPIENYFTNSNGVITAIQDCKLLISCTMRWQDATAGQRGIGLFTGVNGDDTGGTETCSTFNYFPYSNSSNRSIYLPPRLFSLSADDHITIRRNTQSGAVYTNGPGMSWLTICVVGKGNN